MDDYIPPAWIDRIAEAASQAACEAAQRVLAEFRASEAEQGRNGASGAPRPPEGKALPGTPEDAQRTKHLLGYLAHLPDCPRSQVRPIPNPPKVWLSCSCGLDALVKGLKEVE
jgi:hypothetical protein